MTGIGSQLFTETVFGVDDENLEQLSISLFDAMNRHCIDQLVGQKTSPEGLEILKS